MRHTYVVIGAKWFDKANGNTYCNAKVIDTFTNDIFYIGFQYGYGDHWFDKALEFIVDTDPAYGKVIKGGCFNIGYRDLKANRF